MPAFVIIILFALSSVFFNSRESEERQTYSSYDSSYYSEARSHRTIDQDEALDQYWNEIKEYINGTETIEVYQMLWDILITFLKAHWVGIGEILLVFLILASLVFLFTGRWAMLGSILNRYFFFGTLFIIGLIFGPQVFANTYFEVVWVVLGLVVFIIIGKIFRR